MPIAQGDRPASAASGARDFTDHNDPPRKPIMCSRCRERATEMAGGVPSCADCSRIVNSPWLPRTWITFALTLALLAGCQQWPPHPSPAPEPGPVVTPVPKPDVLPVPVSGLRVLIVYEQSTLRQLPPSQINAIQSSVLRKWLDDNKAQYRILDKDAEFARPGPWKDFFDKALAENKPLPWMWVAGKEQVSQAVPLKTGEIITLLEDQLP